MSHLSSLTVSVRPSSSVPWNFSIAACASCAEVKRTRPYPCAGARAAELQCLQQACSRLAAASQSTKQAETHSAT